MSTPARLYAVTAEAEASDEAPALITDAEAAYVTETATGLTFSPDTPIEVWGRVTERLIRQHKRIEWVTDCGKIVSKKLPRRVGSTRGRHRGVGSMPRQYTPRVALICDQCGTPFSLPPTKAVSARFCGRACYFSARRDQDPQARFWAMVEKTDSCWLWIGSKAAGGYGKFSIGGTLHPAHRVAYQWIVGPIPPGMHLDHLCRIRNCVRPSHVEAVTPRENLLRGVGLVAVNAKKTTCKRGHPLEGDNLHQWRGARGCRTCRKESSDAHHARQRAAKATSW